MSKRIFRKKCRVCGAAFSAPRIAKLKDLLARHDCRAEQQKHAAAAASKRMFDSIIQGAMLGMLGRFLSGGLGPITGPDSAGIYHAKPLGAILPPPTPGAKRTKNPLYPANVKSTPRPVEKRRRKPPSE